MTEMKVQCVMWPICTSVPSRHLQWQGTDSEDKAERRVPGQSWEHQAGKLSMIKRTRETMIAITSWKLGSTQISGNWLCRWVDTETCDSSVGSLKAGWDSWPEPQGAPAWKGQGNPPKAGEVTESLYVTQSDPVSPPLALDPFQVRVCILYLWLC
jgi:hypothetical protein